MLRGIMDAADLLLTEVRELVRARGIDPLKDASDLEQLITEAEEDYLRRSDAGLVPPLIDSGAAFPRAGLHGGSGTAPELPR